MARYRKESTSKRDKAPIRARVCRHIAALGVGGPKGYLRWCEAVGVPARFDKSQEELSREQALERARQEQRRRVGSLRHHPVRLLEAICRAEITAEEVGSATLQPLFDAVSGNRLSPQRRDDLVELITTVDRRADFLFDRVTFGERSYPYLAALATLAERRPLWRRSLASWRPATHNRRRQLSSLLRHLLVDYDVPSFMDSVWFRDDATGRAQQEWFLRLGEGGSLRHEATPIALTKRMAHYVLRAPDHSTVEQALRWGQVLGLGGDERLADAIVVTRLGASFEHETFWATVLRFFVEHPMLERGQIAPIVDYLQNQRFDSRMVFTAPGVREPLPPEQPNLCMRGRRPEALLRQVDRWHERLGKARGDLGQRWQPSGIAPFEMTTGRSRENLKVWRIRELLSAEELGSEGRAMRHCVVTYAAACARGSSSIWAMELEGYEGVEKRQTVEVNHHRIVVQCRGKLNRRPTVQELDVLTRWASAAGLQVAQQVREAR